MSMKIMDISDLISIKKASLWEEAKGKLRAMVAVEGMGSASDRWRDASEEIDNFIKSFEEQALHE